MDVQPSYCFIKTKETGRNCDVEQFFLYSKTITMPVTAIIDEKSVLFTLIKKRDALARFVFPTFSFWYLPPH